MPPRTKLGLSTCTRSRPGADKLRTCARGAIKKVQLLARVPLTATQSEVTKKSDENDDWNRHTQEKQQE
jgi:hypothetical protein